MDHDIRNWHNVRAGNCLHLHVWGVLLVDRFNFTLIIFVSSSV